MLWIKALHLVFMVTWFAGLFYLPRLFVYAAENPSGDRHQLLLVMQRRLLGITHIGAALTVLFGLALLWQTPSLLGSAWMQSKLVLAAGLIGYHAWSALLVRNFATGANRHSALWYRWFNEVPALFLLAIIPLAVIKPW